MTAQNHGVPATPRRRFGGIGFDPIELGDAVARIAARPATAPFAYVCTPNAEYVDWAARRPEVRELLEAAWLSSNDSRILQRVAAWRGVALPFAPGSYIVRDLFVQGLIAPADRLTVIGGTTDMIAILAARFGLTAIAQHIPPMGFIRDPAAVAAAVEFVCATPARFVFIAMGPPHSDLLAAAIARHGGATGLGLNIGSSLGTLAGLNARTPDWMENSGLVWLYRLLREPRRLWRRYLGRSLRGLAIAVWRGGR